MVIIQQDPSKLNRFSVYRHFLFSQRNISFFQAIFPEAGRLCLCEILLLKAKSSALTDVV